MSQVRASSPLSMTLYVLAAAVMTACGGGNGGAVADEEPLQTAQAQMKLPSASSNGTIGTIASGGPIGSGLGGGTKLPPPTPTPPPPPPAPTPPPPPPPPVPSGSARLNWDAPATMANGRAIGSLLGFRIHYGTAPGAYTKSVDVSGATTLSGTVSGLPTGTWYFTVGAIDSSGNESSLGYEVSKTL